MFELSGKYRISIAQQPNNVHWQTFLDLGSDMVWALRHLGYDCDALGWAGYRPHPGKQNILLGWHVLDALALATSLPRGTILYNLEQLRNRPDGLLQKLAICSHRYPVWDYSQANIDALNQCNPGDVKHVPVGSMAAIVSEPARQPPATGVSVLFYGSLNDRRYAMLQKVANRVSVRVVPFGTYGAERDRQIDAAKIILNIHYYLPGSFEIVRCAHLFARHKAVVSERNADTELDADLEGAAEFVPYEQLPEACERLVRDETARRQLEERAYQTISKRNEVEILREALRTCQVMDTANVT